MTSKGIAIILDILKQKEHLTIEEIADKIDVTRPWLSKTKKIGSETVYKKLLYEYREKIPKDTLKKLTTITRIPSFGEEVNTDGQTHTANLEILMKENAELKEQVRKLTDVVSRLVQKA